MRRLELGASLAEVARACEVNPNVLHRWRRECTSTGSRRFTGQRQERGRKRAGSPNWNGRWAARPWRSIFCKDACSMSRSSAGCKH